MEEGETTTVYDDYKFVTVEELHDLGLSHLIGTNLLRAYMHGYFIDIRLYRKAKSIIEPYSVNRYKEKKIKDKIAQQRPNRVQVEVNIRFIQFRKIRQVKNVFYLKIVLLGVM